MSAPEPPDDRIARLDSHDCAKMEEDLAWAKASAEKAERDCAAWEKAATARQEAIGVLTEAVDGWRDKFLKAERAAEGLAASLRKTLCLCYEAKAGKRVCSRCAALSAWDAHREGR